ESSCTILLLCARMKLRMVANPSSNIRYDEDLRKLEPAPNRSQNFRKPGVDLIPPSEISVVKQYSVCESPVWLSVYLIRTPGMLPRALSWKVPLPFKDPNVTLLIDLSARAMKV